MKLFFGTKLGRIYHADALNLMATMEDQSVNLIVTSPPFGLVRKKDYGNVDADEYLDWFRPFAVQFKRILRPNGSLVIDIGGAWIPGQPTRSLYHYELAIMLHKEMGLHLAQEFFWWSPSRLPTPAEWVTVRRVRVKDAIDPVWWFSPTPWPKASNRRVLAPYSDSMKTLLANGYKAKLRPSGHDISENFARDNGASIPPNLIALPNTESNSYYIRACEEKGISPHPARFPAELPEYFIRMLTDKGDLVFDPFGGSCVTAEVAERLGRRWVTCDVEQEYLFGGLSRFDFVSRKNRKRITYSLPSPASLWDESEESPALPEDGGKKRPVPTKKVQPVSSHASHEKSEAAEAVFAAPGSRRLL